MAELRLENTGKVSGIFEIDLDKGLLSCLHISDGWQTFHIKDVSTAAYQAYRKSDLSQDERWRRFFEYLDDKQVSRLEVAPDGLQGSRRLRSDDLQFDGEISEVNGALNFYLSCWFDVDEVFGTHVVTDENSDWLNVYGCCPVLAVLIPQLPLVWPCVPFPGEMSIRTPAALLEDF